MSKKYPKGMGDPDTRSAARARVWKGEGEWWLEVRDSDGKVVDYDNARDWGKVYSRALEFTASVRDIENVGHRLVRDYAFLVDHVRDC